MKLKDGYDEAALARAESGMRALSTPGLLRMTMGPDAGLREGNWDYGFVIDLEDREAYRIYNEDAEHNRLRAELAQLAEQIVRCQFEL